MLEVLVRNEGKLVSQRQLLQEVWGPSYETETNYLRVYLAQLRRKLEPDPSHPRHLITEPGMGYRFVAGSPTRLGTLAGVKKVVVLGSTGSIGEQALEVIQAAGEELELVGISAHSSWEQACEQARELDVPRLAIADPAAAERCAAERRGPRRATRACAS